MGTDLEGLEEILEAFKIEYDTAYVNWTDINASSANDGLKYPLNVNATLTTAERTGKGQAKSGADCPITEAPVFKVGEIWYGPVKIVKADAADLRQEDFRIALAKAKAAGLTDADIDVLQRRGI